MDIPLCSHGAIILFTPCWMRDLGETVWYTSRDSKMKNSVFGNGKMFLRMLIFKCTLFSLLLFFSFCHICPNYMSIIFLGNSSRSSMLTMLLVGNFTARHRMKRNPAVKRPCIGHLSVVMNRKIIPTVETANNGKIIDCTPARRKSKEEGIHKNMC